MALDDSSGVIAALFEESVVPEGTLPLQPETNLTGKTLIGTLWLMGWRLFSRSLGLVSTLVLARVLLPGDFGIVAMATTFAASIEILSQLGLQDALTRRVGESRRLFNTAFTLQLGRALLIAGIVAGASPAVVWWFGEPRLRPVLFVLALNSCIAGLENVGISDYRRAMRYDQQFKLFFLPRVLQVMTTIPLALLLRSYWALLAGIVVSQSARTAMTYVLHSFRPRLALVGWRELAGFSFWMWAASAASVVWERVDPIILGPAVGTAQLGLYLLAVELAILPVTELVVPAADVLFAAFSNAQKQGDSSISHAPLVAGAMILGVMPVTITISCGSAYVVAALLGSHWQGAVPIVSMMSWLCLFSPMSWVCSAALVANGHVRRNFLGKLAASAVKLAVLLSAVALTHRLIPIAFSVTTCFCAESFCFVFLLKGTGEVSLMPMFRSILRIVLAGAVVVWALFELGLAWQHIEMATPLAFACCAALGALTTLLFFAALSVIWRVSGRPDGPEKKLASLAMERLRPLVARFSSTV